MDWSRRRALQLGLLGSAVLFTGGIGLSLQRTVLRTPARPLQILSLRDFSILAAVAERFHPGKETLPSATSLGVAESIDEHLAKSDPHFARELSKALRFFENAAVRAVFEQRWEPFTQASPEVQDRSLAAWRDARSHLRRQVFHAMLGLCSASYWGKPETWSVIGYRLPTIPRPQ